MNKETATSSVAEITVENNSHIPQVTENQEAMPQAQKTRVQPVDQPAQKHAGVSRKRKPLGTRSTNGVLPRMVSGGTSIPFCSAAGCPIGLVADLLF